MGPERLDKRAREAHFARFSECQASPVSWGEDETKISSKHGSRMLSSPRYWASGAMQVDGHSHMLDRAAGENQD